MNRLENNMETLQKEVKEINLQINSNLIPNQGVFFDGQVFDAYELASKIIRSAKSSIVLIDNYIDETAITHLTKKKKNVKVLLLTKTISKQLTLDIQKANEQYGGFVAKQFTQSHDRFLIIDEGKEVYHIGASFKEFSPSSFSYSCNTAKYLLDLLKRGKGMARADLLCDIIRSGLKGDEQTLRKAVEAIAADERSKNHTVLAEKIEILLNTIHHLSPLINDNSRPNILPSRDRLSNNLFFEKNPEKTIEELVLSDSVKQSCHELIEEQMRSDLLHSYGVDPRNKILLIGPPGNGKTSLAEALANALMVPFYIVKYENIVGAYLGETASNLARLFEHARTRHCVLFFDEFETLGKERGDEHETGEIKRVVSSLLLQIDVLPSYVVIVAATNHDSLLDSAVWRRFQLKIELPKPTISELESLLSQFEERNNFKFDVGINTMSKMLLGKSYAEAEEFALSVYRQYILHQPNADIKYITESQLKLYTSPTITQERKHA